MYVSEDLSDFRFHVDLDAFSKAGEGDDKDKMWVGGIVSTSKLDKQEERVLQQGLDFSEFLADGWYNDNHGQKTVDVLGYPTEAKYVTKGERLPNGQRAETAGWWTEGYLLNTDEGRKVWSLARSLSKAPRKLGFSIEGKILKRSGPDQKTIARAKVRNVAITHCPVNTDTELHVLSKALMAGDAIGNPGASPGEGFALRAESVEGGRGPAAKPAHDPVLDIEEGDFGTDDDTDEPEAKGCGCDDVKKAVEEDFEIEAMSEVELGLEWADAIAQSVANPSPRLSKAQAEQFIAVSRPDLSAESIRQIVERSIR